MPAEDFEPQRDQLRRDLVEGLSFAFEMNDDGVRVLQDNFRDDTREDVRDSVGFAWECHAVNRGSFQGMKPTDRSVIIRGFTIVETLENGENRYRRYVDWSEVAAQLGMVTSFKPVRAEPPEFPAPSG